MADIKLTLKGENEASGAFNDVAASTEALGEAAGKSVEKWRLVSEAIKKAAEAVYEFGKQSVEVFLEQEKADRQLQAVAGSLTETFKAQASAMQEHLGVSGVMVEQMQTMLLRFGEAPAQVEATTKAILDYSAATGTDAVAATQHLLTSTQGGKAAFSELGETFVSTGSKSRDLAKHVAFLAEKVGGSADSEADSAAGAARKATEAMGDLKVEFGALITDFIIKTDVIGDLTLALRGLKVALFGDEDEAKRDKANRLLERELRLIQEIAVARKALAAAKESGDTSEAAFQELAISAAQAQLDDYRGKVSGLIGETKLPTVSIAGVDDRTTKAAGGSHDSENARLARAYDSAIPAGLRLSARNNTVSTAAMDVGEDSKPLDTRAANQIEKTFRELELKAKAEAEKSAKEWAQAGETIGGALANGIASSIDQLASGGEMDIGSMLGSLLGTVLSVAGLGPLGGAIGSLVTTGIHGMDGTNSRRGRRHHEGGWIERYHEGGFVGGPDEVPAILQTGERVLSRSEVSAMGGRAGVDGRASGAVSVTVNAMDASTMQSFWERSGGRALLNAVRDGKGAPALLFGGG